MVVDSLSDYLELKRDRGDPHLDSVTGCHVTLWLEAVRNYNEDSSNELRLKVTEKLQKRLEAMIMDPKWFDRG